MSSQSENPKSTALVKPTPSESILNEKWDLCLSNLIIKSSLGAAAGVVFGVVVFKRRMWPVWLGMGIGAGRAWEGCEREFKEGAGTTGARVVRR